MAEPCDMTRIYPAAGAPRIRATHRGIGQRPPATYPHRTRVRLRRVRRATDWGIVVNSHRFERIRNLRDLGGRVTPDGRRVVKRRLFRSGSLHEITDEDRSALEALGIRTVIDLRSEWERRHQPDEWPGVRIVSAPLVDDQLVASINARFEAGTIPSEELADWWQLTRVFQAPEEHTSSVRVIFDTLLETGPDDAVLFHCRGGKDRTGMVAALVLEALAVTREETLADFMRSNGVADDKGVRGELAAIIAQVGGSSWSDEAILSLTGVRREWLDTLFHRIEDRYGSVTRYLTDHVGIGDRGIARLREIYLEPAGD